MTLLTASRHPSELGRTAPPFQLSTDDLRELSAHAAPIDVPTLTDHCLDNLAFGLTLLEEFAKTAHDRVEALANQVAQANLNEVAAMAHALKGVVGMLAMHSLFKIFVSMESAVRDSDLASLQSQVSELRDEMQRVLDYIPNVRAMALREQAVQV